VFLFFLCNWDVIYLANRISVSVFDELYCIIHLCYIWVTNTNRINWQFWADCKHYILCGVRCFKQELKKSLQQC
jgi:hypothetical protein